MDRFRGHYQFRSAAGELGGWFRPGLVRSDPRGGELKKSRRNRGVIHGDFYGGEAVVFANYALALYFDCDSFLLPFPARNGL
jgi:hypothetical protein